MTETGPRQNANPKSISKSEIIYAFTHTPRDKSSNLSELAVFEDSYIGVDGTLYRPKDVLERIERGRIRASPADGETLAILGVAECRIRIERQVRFDHELRTVVLDASGRLQGGPTSLIRFQRILSDYIDWQSPQLMARAREAYEAIPHANRFAVLDDLEPQNGVVEQLLQGHENEQESALRVLKEWRHRYLGLDADGGVHRLSGAKDRLQCCYREDDRSLERERFYVFGHDARTSMNTLKSIRVFEDQRIEIDGTFTAWDDVLKGITDGRLRACPCDGELLAIPGTGFYWVHIERQIRFDHELRTVLLDALARLTGQPWSKTRFQESLIEFIESRSPHAFDRMKQAYEGVPTATRFAVLDDMDVKNRPIERLLRGGEDDHRAALQDLEQWVESRRRARQELRR